MHGHVTEKKLNLFEFASRSMAEPSNDLGHRLNATSGQC